MTTITDDAWNDWLKHPVTRLIVSDLSKGYSAEMRKLARAVIDATGYEKVISGRIEKTEEILAMFKAVPPADLDPDSEDNQQDPATIANWQDNTMGAT